jgi:hypothetical protein
MQATEASEMAWYIKALPYLLAIVLVALGMHFLRASGAKDEAIARDLKAAQDSAKEAIAARDDYQMRVLEVQRLAETRAKTNTVIKTVTQEVIREVPIYIPAATPPLPGGFRVLHDAAATGTPIDPAATSGAEVRPSGPEAAAPAPVPVTEAAEVVIENYGAYHQLANDYRLLLQYIDKECK